MVESKLVELVVAGSSPVGHPIFDFKFEISDFKSFAHLPSLSDDANDTGPGRGVLAKDSRLGHVWAT